MSRSNDPLFLARETYRRRRLMDAARLLPILASVLFILPVLWAGGSGTASGIGYLFVVWAVLIGLSVLVSWRLPTRSSDDHGSRSAGDGEAQ